MLIFGGDLGLINRCVHLLLSVLRERAKLRRDSFSTTLSCGFAPSSGTWHTIRARREWKSWRRMKSGRLWAELSPRWELRVGFFSKLNAEDWKHHMCKLPTLVFKWQQSADLDPEIISDVQDAVAMVIDKCQATQNWEVLPIIACHSFFIYHWIWWEIVESNQLFFTLDRTQTSWSAAMRA